MEPTQTPPTCEPTGLTWERFLEWRARKASSAPRNPTIPPRMELSTPNLSTRGIHGELPSSRGRFTSKEVYEQHILIDSVGDLTPLTNQKELTRSQSEIMVPADDSATGPKNLPTESIWEEEFVQLHFQILKPISASAAHLIFGLHPKAPACVIAFSSEYRPTLVEGIRTLQSIHDPRKAFRIPAQTYISHIPICRTFSLFGFPCSPGRILCPRCNPGQEGRNCIPEEHLVDGNVIALRMLSHNKLPLNSFLTNHQAGVKDLDQ